MLKERIIKHASVMFSLHGVKKVSMDELASNLGISKRTIYSAFNNKEDVLRSCIIAFQENKRQSIFDIMNQSENIIYGYLQVIDYYKSTRLPEAILWEDIYKYYPELYQSILMDVEKDRGYFKQLLNKGIKDNYFREDLHFDGVVYMLDISTFMINNGSPSERASYFRTDLIFNIMVNMLRGISTTKGSEIIDKYIADLPHSNN